MRAGRDCREMKRAERAHGPGYGAATAMTAAIETHESLIAESAAAAAPTPAAAATKEVLDSFTSEATATAATAGAGGSAGASGGRSGGSGGRSGGSTIESALADKPEAGADAYSAKIPLAPYAGNPLLTRYADAASIRAAPAVPTQFNMHDNSNVPALRKFCAELADDATRISRIHLGLETLENIDFAWEALPDAYPSAATGLPVTLWSAPSPAILPESTCGPSSRVVKSECVIRASKHEIAKLMQDDSRSAEYDKYVKEYNILYVDEAARQHIRHYTYASVWPTSPRDLAVLSTSSVEADGSILISTISVPDHFVPTAADHVRARVLSSCCLISPRRRSPSSQQQVAGDGREKAAQAGEEVTEEPEECVVTFVSHINPGGSVPKLLTN